MMERLPLAAVLVAALAAAGLALVLSGWLRRLRGTRVGRRSNRRGQRGERDAMRLLRRSGFDICDHHPSAHWTIECDGEVRKIALRADFLVAKQGRRYIVEVKTGDFAPQLSNASTRRQLLEYCLAYGVDEILLVDPEDQEIHRVSFPNRPVMPSRAWAWAPFAAGAVSGAAAVAAVIGWSH